MYFTVLLFSSQMGVYIKNKSMPQLDVRKDYVDTNMSRIEHLSRDVGFPAFRRAVVQDIYSIQLLHRLSVG